MLLLWIRLINIVVIFLIVLGLIYLYYRMVTPSDAQQKAKNEAKGRDGEIPASDAGVRDLIAEGRLSEAVELYQRFTGTDQFTAREAVADMEREMRLTDDVRDSIQQMLRADRKAEAIEEYQAVTGATLKEALAYVERVENPRGRRNR